MQNLFAFSLQKLTAFIAAPPAALQITPKYYQNCQQKSTVYIRYGVPANPIFRGVWHKLLKYEFCNLR